MRTLRLLALCAVAASPLAAGVSFQQHNDRVEVFADGKPLTTLYFGPGTTKPYLHPLRAADGTVVTRHYPMRNDVAGEAHDHPHHRGMWFSHGEVNGFDFWANESDQEPQSKKGRIVLAGVRKAGDGLIRAAFEWRSPDGKALLSDDRIYRFALEGDNVIIDNEIRLEAVHKPVHFGDTKEGTFAIRIHPTMRESTPERKPGKGKIVAASGARGEKQAWGKPAPWVDYYGPIGRKTYGITIMDHPFNPRHPTHWHVRAYGLFAANIFGEHHFYDDDSRDASITLEPGQQLNFRYRVVIHPGDTSAAGVAALYDRWAGGSTSSLESEVLAAEKHWAGSVTARDFKALNDIYDNSLIYAHSTGAIETKGEYMEKLQTGTAKYDAIDYERSTVRVHGDSAVAHHIVVMKGTNAAGPFDNRLMMIHTWVKKGGAWRLAAHQTTQIARR